MRRATCLILATGIVGLVAACASRQQTARVPGTTRPASSVVPWVDWPAPKYQAPTPPPPPTGARPCTASDLTVVSAQEGAATGHIGLVVRLVNHSSSACEATGYPTVTGVRRDGTLIALQVGHGTFIGDPGPEANTEPGKVVAFNLGSSDVCNAATRGTTMLFPEFRIGIRHGGYLTVSGRGFNIVCGLDVSRFGVPVYAESQGPPPPPLAARISAPATARPGEDFNYTVTLTNPTRRPVSLTPCPAYEEAVFAARGGSVDKNYYLNCDTIRQIGPHSSVTYQMRLQLPANLAASGVAKFAWQFQGGAGPFAGSILTLAP
jgi:hypothetical protein